MVATTTVESLALYKRCVQFSVKNKAATFSFKICIKITLEICLFAVLHHGLRGPGGDVHSAALPPAGQGSSVRKWMVG